MVTLFISILVMMTIHKFSFKSTFFCFAAKKQSLAPSVLSSTSSESTGENILRSSVCVRVKERVCEYVSVCVCLNERMSVCVFVSIEVCVCACVFVWEKESVCVWSIGVHVCMREGERECVFVSKSECVCMKECVSSYALVAHTLTRILGAT